MPMTTSDVMEAPPPLLSLDEAVELARTTFGIEATAEPLVSERDQNVRLVEAGGTAWVLKVSNAAEDPGVVDMEVAAVEWIANFRSRGRDRRSRAPRSPELRSAAANTSFASCR
jgi:Ser/Thr protein kinase RdoA (MazF antagonist)